MILFSKMRFIVIFVTAVCVLFLWNMFLESKVLLSSNVFHTNLSFLDIQTVIKSHFLMSVAPNLAILIFSTCFFHF